MVERPDLVAGADDPNLIATDLDGVGDFEGAGVDSGDGAFVRVSHPDGVVGGHHINRVVTDIDGVGDCATARVDSGDVVVADAGDPDAVIGPGEIGRRQFSSGVVTIDAYGHSVGDRASVRIDPRHRALTSIDHPDRVA